MARSGAKRWHRSALSGALIGEKGRHRAKFRSDRRNVVGYLARPRRARENLAHRRARKNPFSSAPASSASTPSRISTRWLWRSCCNTSKTLPAAPVLGSRAAEDHACDTRMHDCARAHRAGFERHVELGVRKAVVAEPAARVAQRQHFCVRGRIGGCDIAVPAFADQLAVERRARHPPGLRLSAASACRASSSARAIQNASLSDAIGAA